MRQATQRLLAVLHQQSQVRLAATGDQAVLASHGLLNPGSVR